MFGIKKCKHDDELIDKTILPSGWDQVVASNPTRLSGFSSFMFKKKVIFTFKCSLCKRVRQTTETNFEL